METKFTKGEWLLKDRSGGYRIKDSEHRDICDIYSFASSISEEESEANAKLIYAAPDMFEQLVSIIDGTAFDKETGLIWEHRLEEIRKVLNKAVGSDSF